MGYNDQCHNDPNHRPAVVGVGPKGDVRWLCMACFDDYLKKATEVLPRKTPPKGTP